MSRTSVLIGFAVLSCATTASAQSTSWPSPVSNAGIVWDSISGKTLLYGGMRNRGEYSDSTLWAWDGATWSAVGDGAPGARSGLILASDPRGRVLLYGGQNRSAQFDDTWEWRNGRWSRVAASGPGARHMTAGVFDPVHNQLVLFGGYSVERQEMLGDTWIFEGTRWQKVSDSGPPGRAGHVLGYDPGLGKVMLMGGADPQGRHFSDTWSWDGARWTRLGEGPAMTPNTQLVRLPGSGLGTFGGWDGSKASGALLRWDRNRWSVHEDPSGPTPRMETALAYDATHRRLVLFGGSDGDGNKLNDLWEFDGKAWRLIGRTSSQGLTTTGAFFALSVPDLEASVRWYSEKLGLQVVTRPPPEEKAAIAVLEGNGLMVELLQLSDARPLSQAAPGVGANHLVHGYFKAGMVVENYEATLELLRARGVEIAMGPFPAQPGQRANVIVRDNAGNLIQFLAK